MQNTTIDDAKIINLTKISSPQGNLSVIENNTDIPFEIKRVFYLYDIPGGQDRGGHAHKKLEQFIIAICGAFDVEVDDGKNKKIYRLDRSFYGLHLKAGLWGELKNFSTGSVVMVLASDIYKEDDYIRNYDEFLKYKGIK